MSVLALNQERAGNLIEGLNKFYGMWNCRTFLETTNEGRIYPSSAAKFISKLYNANLKTYNKKYNENIEGLDIFRAIITGEAFTPCQVLKTLECLNYNIELEYVPECKAILENLETLINEIRCNIIKNLDEYENSKWG